MERKKSGVETRRDAVDQQERELWVRALLRLYDAFNEAVDQSDGCEGVHNLLIAGPTKTIGVIALALGAAIPALQLALDDGTAPRDEIVAARKLFERLLSGNFGAGEEVL